MRKRSILVICFFALFLVLFPSECVRAQTDSEMNIYALYLGEEEKGDSVLLESEGHYLLIDIGIASQVPTVIEQLEQLEVTHVDIMFSHLHVDHMGAKTTDITLGLRLMKEAGITIDTLYLPAQWLTPLSSIYSVRYSQLAKFMREQGSGQTVYLQTGDRLVFGDVSGEVIGPLNSLSLSPSQLTQYTTQKERETAYENNCSLAVIFTCGSTRYFTAGDSYGEETDALVERYGDSLKCDIMKLCHHGTGSGNSKALLKAVQPKYSFATNTGLNDILDSTGRWRVYTALHRASQYGMCYLVGNEKKTLIYHIVNDNITLYPGPTIESEEKITGWLYLYGADGTERTHDMYYFDSDGQLCTGVQKIGSRYYFFAESGQMEYGTYKSNGSYTGWRTYSDGKRYFKRSSDGKYSYMSHGATKVGDRYFYFDKNGYWQTVDEEEIEDETIVQFGSYYYAMDVDGSLRVNDWAEIDGDYYYFDSKGHMVINTTYQIDGDYFLFDEDGCMVEGDGGTELYKLKNKIYGVRKDGSLVTGGFATIKGKKYYFNKTGQMVKNCTFKLSGKKYKASKSGVVTMVKSK